MRFIYRPARTQAQIDEPFERMQEEGLLSCAMYAFAEPGLEDWRRVTAPDKGLLLRCEDSRGRLLACGLFSPRRGKIWEFDFTAFRDSAHLAPLMARQAFAWIFEQRDCAASRDSAPRPTAMPGVWRKPRVFTSWGDCRKPVFMPARASMWTACWCSAPKKI